MHPSLDLGNVSQLPTSVRGLATRAAHGSAEDLRILIDMLAERETLPGMKMLCLPVLHVNLNPIPQEEDAHGSPASTRAILSLQGIRLLDFPIEAGVELWPRTWRWLSFLHGRRDSLPEPLPEIDICSQLLFILGRLVSDPPSLLLLEKTIGLRTLITRSWRLIFRDENPDGLLLYALLWISRDLMQLFVPANMHEAIEGAGGSLDDLAELVIKYVNYFVPTGRTAVSTDTLFHIDAIYCVIEAIGAQPTRSIFGSVTPGNAALLSAGITASLINVMCAFHASNLEYDIIADILGAALLTFYGQMTRCPPRWYRYIQEGVTAGLLRGLISYGIRGVEAEFTSEVLATILSASTLYQSVVSRMQLAIQDVDQLTKHPAFAEAEMLKSWRDFRQLAEKRIALMQFRKSAEYKSRKACDNMECGEIRPKADFKCCGHCHQVYYCCQSCQWIDWERHHRCACSSMRSFGLQHRDPLSARNMSFLRTILHDDYTKYKHAILCQQIALLHRSPTVQIATVFFYSIGERPQISVQVSSTLPALSESGVNFKEFVARAARSSGQMDLHIMVMHPGGGPTARVFPMRSNTSTLYDEVRRLAAVGEEPAVVSRKLQDFIEISQLGLIEIH
ncbi:hypothetical protein C8R44DRAFT_976478 [Mycena epipterygia]|nr:hypothetical protein C8R44DRAFT_976478 [Mycena epipterygia]